MEVQVIFRGDMMAWNLSQGALYCLSLSVSELPKSSEKVETLEVAKDFSKKLLFLLNDLTPECAPSVRH